MSHKCAVPGCGKMISKILLMCRRHWNLLPINFRAYVWNLYRNKHRDEASRLAHVAACNEAVEMVQQSLSTTQKELHP